MLKLFPPKHSLKLVETKIRFFTSLSPPSDLTTIILHSKTPEQALDTFTSVLKQNPNNPTKKLHLYSAVIHYLTGAKVYPTARCLTKDLIQTLLQSCTPRRVNSLVFNALSQLRGSKFNPSVFGVLIIAFSEVGLVDEALRVYLKVGAFPAVQACNALLNGLLKKSSFDIMWELYNNMVSRRLFPTVVTYNVLVDACCRQGDVLRAKSLISEMVKKGIEPTVVIYTTLIHGLCSESKLMEAESMFRQMKDSGVFPNLYTYNVLMDGYCKTANVKQALHLYQGMLDDGLQPNVVTFGILIDALCKVRELLAARRFFVQMAKFGVVPNVVVFNSLIDGYSKAGNCSEATDLLLEMEKFKISPDVFTYSILIKNACRLGTVEEADDILKRMEKEGVPANSVVYNSLIDGYCKEGNMEKALEIFKATKFFSDMRRNGLRPDALAYAVMLQGHLNAKHMADVMMLHADMIKMGIVPNEVTSQVVRRGYQDNGYLKSALWCSRDLTESCPRTLESQSPVEAIIL
ncbi:pentatricopeptide repeat-containing protein, putative [Ricinus communis]|uniref:Pentatricopeptide repeat-containing protein, putative n=1 Tax=Ricinus communis TaxID=3988 RepID=B9RLV9_RICCO|nr:pentatricopeptide repeat-containing protein, putative [Ricinus communis]